MGLDLVAIPEIASMLGVSKQRVSAIIKTHSDFPEPDDELSIGRVWKRSRIEAWIKEYEKKRRRAPSSKSAPARRRP